MDAGMTRGWSFRVTRVVKNPPDSAKIACLKFAKVIPLIGPGSSMLNKYSSRITQPKSQGASQAMLYATGMSEEDMNKAQVGIASVWYDGNPCNMHLNDLADEVKKGVVDAGLVGMRFNGNFF